MPRATRSPRTRLSFERHSVQLLAAWTLAMGGLGATQSMVAARGAGASTPAPTALSAPATTLPPQSARLPRR